MPDALPLTGLYGKVPAHGDFVRRGLPSSFVGPWDAWLQSGIEAARERLGDRWAAAWDTAPPWRFALPAGACGPDAVAGVLLTSEDMVGRRFPITLAAVLPTGGDLPAAAWFATLEAAALAGRAGRMDADGLAAAIPAPGAEMPALMAAWPLAPVAHELPTASIDADGFGLAWAAASMPAADGEAAPAGGDVTLVLGAEAAAPDDVLGLLCGADASASPFDGTDAVANPPAEGTDGAVRPVDDDVLGLLAGSAASPLRDDDRDAAANPAGEGTTGTIQPADDDVMGLLGAAGASPPREDGRDVIASPMTAETSVTPPPADDDVLGLLIGAASEPSAARADASPSDGTLAFLLGEGGGATDRSARPLPGGSAATEQPAGIDPPVASIPQDAELPRGEAAAPVLVPAEVPAAPPGGGWWTGGGGRVAASVRPHAALPPAAEFVSLLEADA